MDSAWLKRISTVLLVFLLAGCTTRLSAPAPDFSAPIVRAPAIQLPTPVVSRSPGADLKLRQSVRATVVVDAGHGGRDPGTQVYRVDEKRINLAVARLVQRKLSERGVTVVMTREADVFVELAERAGLSQRADAFVSIHADSNPDVAKAGHSVIYPHGHQGGSGLLGRLIDTRMMANGSRRYALRADNRGLHVLRRAQCPAVLIELGYLSNPREAARLASGEYQERLAAGIAEGILMWLDPDQRALAAR